VLVLLQFQDRVDQILGHVVNSTSQMVKQVTQRMKIVKLTVCPTSLISSTCGEVSKPPNSTTEEQLNHKDREVHGLPINEPSELTF
jgi:hypothetical protein